MSINNVNISGNLTRDAEMRTTQGGMAILSLSVAVNDRKKNPNGEWEDYPNFIDCTVFGRRAEAIQNYLTKGTKVAIQGKLKQERWEDKDGNNRSKVSVIVQEIEFNAQKSRSNAETEETPTSAYADEDIPF